MDRVFLGVIIVATAALITSAGLLIAGAEILPHATTVPPVWD